MKLPLGPEIIQQGSNKRKTPLDLLISIVIGVAAFVLYLVALAPTVLTGDAGEFQFVPYLLGIAHPTGYPLYCLLGWIWSHLLPFGDVAYRMNLFSAFWAALAVALLYFTARALVRQAIPRLSPAACRLLGALAAATFAVTPSFWSQAIIAEVYSLHIFFLVLILYLLLLWSEGHARIRPLRSDPGEVQQTVLYGSAAAPQQGPAQHSPRFLLLAAGIFGLSLAHHSTTVLMVPAVVAYVLLAGRGVFRQWRQVLLPGLLLLLLPLALYLYIPWRAPDTPYLQLPLAAGQELTLYDNTPVGLLRFVTGGPFGGSVDLSVNLGARLTMAKDLIRYDVGWIGISLALLGVLGLALSRKWSLLALTGLIFGAIVAFDLVYTIGDIYVLFIGAYLIVVLWMALGVGILVRVAGQRPLAALLVLPFFALPMWLAVTHYAAVDQSHNTKACTRWQEILSQPLPQESVLVSNDRNEIMPMWYYQYVDGQRPDLLGLFPLITPKYPSLGPVLDLAMSTDRPVYLVKDMPGVEVKVATQPGPGGELWRVTGPATAGEMEYMVSARLANALDLAGYDLSPRTPRPGDTLEVSLYWDALTLLDKEYHSSVQLFDAEGNRIAQSDGQPGGAFYPTTLWQPGERLRDDHLLEVPAGTQPGVYRLLVGMYSFASDGSLVPLADPVFAGELTIQGPG